MNTKMIPSIFTLANLLLGIVSLIYTLNEEWQLAATMILIGMVLDGMDGRLARRLDATSPFGKELDSLCDLVSFGVAPALLAYAYKLVAWPYFGMAIAIGFTLCGAIRLARFNVLNISDFFVGIPITAAGSLVAIMVLLAQRIPNIAFPISMVILSYLMVSKLKIKKY
ncbi:MAG: CDP-diacylglycerol--serine O-phosphatidyltransferase [Carboxydocellales bacterium]